MYKIKFTVAIAFSQQEVYPANFVKEFDAVPEYFKPFIENGTLVVLEDVQPAKQTKKKMTDL
jgi:hypothetical protein